MRARFGIAQDGAAATMKAGRWPSNAPPCRQARARSVADLRGRGLVYIDCPVTGCRCPGRRELTLLRRAEPADSNRHGRTLRRSPHYPHFGRGRHRHGPYKLTNTLMVCDPIAGIAEGLVYCEQLALDMKLVV